VGLYTELFYAIIPTLFLCFFTDLLSLHLVTFLMFFILVNGVDNILSLWLVHTDPLEKGVADIHNTSLAYT